MAATVQQEHSIFNLKGELVATVLTHDGDTTNAKYKAGIPAEYVDAVKNAAHPPTKKNKS